MDWNKEEYRKELGKYLANWVKEQIEVSQKPNKFSRYQISHKLRFDNPGKNSNECSELRRLEKGHKKWKIDQLIELANATGKKPSDILWLIENIISQKK